MLNWKTNPTALTPLNIRRHITIIVLLCLLVALSGAAVQAYRVYDAGWIPNATSAGLSSHSGTYYKHYESTRTIHLYCDSNGLLYIQSRPSGDAICFIANIRERQYNHLFRKVKKRPPLVGMQFRIEGSSFHAYSTYRFDSIVAIDTTNRPDVLFVEGGGRGEWTYPDGIQFREIQKPYPQDVLDALDAYFTQEYAQQMVNRDPLYADFPIVRHDGIDPAFPAVIRNGSTQRQAISAAAHRYARLEFGTPESPLTLYDWFDGAKNALLYIALPIVFLDLVGYWGIYRMMLVRPRLNRKMRGECVRCGYPLIDGLCCECGLRVDVETNDTTTP
ncbi:MAG: hypothetical protein JKY43_06985 [Phycisphaerales bacterium]|nr:hypothetical protein [Phycisphaerales bacterium]